MTYTQVVALDEESSVFTEDGLPFLFATVNGGAEGGALEASADGETWVAIATAGANETVYTNGVHPERRFQTTGTATAVLVKGGTR